MINLNPIIECVSSLLPDWGKDQTSCGLEDFASEFHQSWMQLGQQLLQHSVQQQVEQVERSHQGCRQKRSRRYHTPLGTIEVTRRIYDSEQGSVCWADQELGLPEQSWLTPVQELASALGVGSEFANATKLFKHWTGVEVCEHSLANQVEKLGSQLHEQETEQPAQAIAPLPSSVELAVQSQSDKPRVYVGADGIMTPLNQQQGYKEARVGVIFWASDHRQLSPKRAAIRHREYVATLDSRAQFQQRLYSLYTQVVKQTPHEVVVLGDGAPWIWQMAAEYFPNSVQVLDFFHVCEYVWAVARAAYPDQEQQQKQWVKQQKQVLKLSQWRQVVQAAQQLPRRSGVAEAVATLERYLSNNHSRIDYQRYLQMGVMIGSGVVESSNRRVVTQRLKQAGMHWSKRGAESIMALRACYLSDSNRWQQFWYPSSA